MNILLVKLSSLGDVVHTLPVVQDLREALPHAHIDWVLEKSFAPMLAHVPGLRRVIPCELRQWRKALWQRATHDAWRRFTADLRAEAYDAVIDLQGLTKSALVARLARLAPRGQRYAMANATDGSGYEAPTRWVADVGVVMPRHSHAVARGRWLAAQALGYTASASPDFGLKPAVAQARSADTAPEKRAVALVHGTSRADKEWPLAHWVALGQRLNAEGVTVVLPHGSASELATSQAIAALLPDAVVWPRLALDALTLALAGCQGVIGVDSGVSHIAVALDLPHVQLYNVDTAWRTGPDDSAAGGRQRSVFKQPFPSVDTVWQAWHAVLRCGAAGDETVQS